MIWVEGCFTERVFAEVQKSTKSLDANFQALQSWPTWPPAHTGGKKSKENPGFHISVKKIPKEQVDSIFQFERDLFYQWGILLVEKLPILLLTLLNWFLYVQVHLSISGWTDRFLNAENESSKMMHYS